MPTIELVEVSNYICRGISLSVKDGQLMVLLGPNGAGKTTLLNIVAGLIEYDGAVLFDGSPVDDIPPHQRGVGYLFQDLALFPHLDVSGNIAYGIKVQRQKKGAIEARVNKLLNVMKIEHLAHRFPRDLSGGERQRVALARALAPSPHILLLDEPFSNLDFRTAKLLRTELRLIQKKFGITMMYVTHNQREAAEISDSIAVIHEGSIEQVGTADEIFFDPHNKNVSEFIGSPNILYCATCRALGRGLMEIDTGSLTIVVPNDGQAIAKIAISPRDIYISIEKPPGPNLNRFKGRIIDITHASSLAWIKLQVGQHTLVSEQPVEIVQEMGLRTGDEIYLILKMRWIRTLSDPFV
jgi:ABC-type Fe3+/spermidine/putrescine transport system ATPase subunit